MRVERIVDTMIGEGLYTGYPCTLIRLSHCNLRCSYCDTEFQRAGDNGEYKCDESLDANLGFDWRPQVEMSPSEIVLNLETRMKQPWILLTGGEPLLWKDTPELVRLLLEGGWKVLVETNGTQDISVLPAGTRIAMDIKTPSSNEFGKHLEENIALLGHGDEIRFVCADSGDIDFALDFLKGRELSCAVSISPVYDSLEPKEILTRIMGKKIRLNIQVHRILEIA